eukprot:3411016-Rhodomonas_salina.1
MQLGATLAVCRLGVPPASHRSAREINVQYRNMIGGTRQNPQSPVLLRELSYAYEVVVIVPVPSFRG